MRNKSAFTLIELLIVMAVLGLLTAMVMLTYPTSQEKARDTRRKSDIKQYQTAMEVYATRHNNLFATSSNAVANATTLCATFNLTSCPDDPRLIGSQPNYKYASTANTYVFWAQLERPNTANLTQWFVVCSNGKAGDSTTQPSNATCPI
ncbi:type II secretion system protein [Candidatus Woesebacteria bacterium]|nr:MAG: type II secretion system protein [Candidatus Woesebacteria bacterium]